MIKKILFLCFFAIHAMLHAQEQEIASWKIVRNVTDKEITDSRGHFTLTQRVSSVNGAVSGMSDTYWPDLDLRSNSFSLEGVFQTEEAADGVMAIAGNRSALSKYTGWDFTIQKNGVLRFLVNDNDGNSKLIMSGSRRFDDGLAHIFSIVYNAKSQALTMTIDSKWTYKGFVNGDLGEHPNRIFYIGAQPATAGGKALQFKGTLKDFVFKGTLSSPKATTSAAPRSLESMDKEMARAKADDATLWVNAKSLTIEGQGWSSGIADYTRLPDKYMSVVTPKVWSLSRHSSGISVRFTVKGTTSISARWTLRGNGYLSHMTAQAVNGLDLYVKMNGQWVWTGVGKPTKDGVKQMTAIKSGFSKTRTYECMLYLPLYSGVSDVEIGFSPESTVAAAAPNPKKPLIIYGTSIVHGCSASRAGMPFPSMLGRHFDVPVINLGFSGNGLIEDHFGDILGEIDASVYIIDCLPNMASFTPKEITERTMALVRKLHRIRPSTPIVLVEDRTYAYAELVAPAVNERRPALKTAYNTLTGEMKNLYYVEGAKLLGDDTEATVDGSHPSDLGMYRYFVALVPVLSKIYSSK